MDAYFATIQLEVKCEQNITEDTFGTQGLFSLLLK